MTNQSLQIFPRLTLANPFWIASADASHTPQSLKRWVSIDPGAITLKTTAPQKKGEDSGVTKGLVDFIIERDPYEKARSASPLSSYSDGSPSREYLSVSETQALVAFCRDKLPKTKVGVSVLMSEDYAGIADALGEFTPDFYELNLKYAARSLGPADSYAEHVTASLNDSLAAIAAAARSLPGPLFVKLPREFGWLRQDCRESRQLLKQARVLRGGKDIGLIVANSLRTNAPREVAKKEEVRNQRSEFSSGVLAGQQLFVSTFDLVRQCLANDERGDVPIVASGGVVSLSDLLYLMKMGTATCQMYSAFRGMGYDYLTTLKESLSALMQEYKCHSIQDLHSVLKGDRANAVLERARTLLWESKTAIAARLFETGQRVASSSTDAIVARMPPPGKRTRVVPGAPPTEAVLLLSEAAPEAGFLAHPGFAPTWLKVRSLEMLNDVVKSVGDTDDWDLALVSQAYIGRLPPSVSRTARRIGVVRYFLVEWGSAEDVVYFGGPESELALSLLKRKGLLAGKTTYAAETNKILTRLKSGRAGFSLLAKDPLLEGWRLLGDAPPIVRANVEFPLHVVARGRRPTDAEVVGFEAAFASWRTLLRKKDAGARDLLNTLAKASWTRYMRL